ncbi:methyl-accepting chemotaxis protein [Desulfosporosinus sp. PR]|uniref:methyl-accepting chemotaxis protein n=1 Tax=Candidatus Desulfosporosinus nitrosoreducens TaxID=3401928 RepID=UPI0027FCF56F|nr:methyl-accepting chemotaxis protein [Desulfosporosinus sp. PR]MDQ7095716.1 methyl-accepting chemotaxis protein [Desulfosporosinus sp. PR]
MEIEKRKRSGRLLSIRTKLASVIAVVIILAVATVEIYDYQSRVSEIEQSVREQQLDTAVLTAARIETEIDKTTATLETAAHNNAFASDNRDVLIQILLAIKEQNPIFSTVFMADAKLTRLNEKGEISSLADREYMQEVQKTKKTVISREILISQATQKPSLMIATPVKVPGAPERYLGISVNIDNLQKIVAQSKKSDSNYSFAFDGKDGLVFAHPVAAYIASLKFINPDAKDKSLVAPELQAMAREAVAGHSGSQVYNFNGSKIIAAYTNIPGTSLGVASRMTYDEIMAPLRKQRNIDIIITLAVALLGAVIALAGAKLIADPLKRLADQANKIAAGDFTQAKAIKVKGQDEIGQLQQAFQAMAGMLKSTMEQIGQAAAQVASSSEELEVSAEQSAQGAGQIAATVTQVALGSVNQVKAVDDTVQTVKEISGEINDIAQHAAEVARVSEESAAAVRDGEEAVHHAIEAITNINGIVQGTAVAIRSLGTFSERISQIVDTISGIASQTNLLALNAAIEAARAGEHGRGFSVVADEVRKLAEQAEESAGSIAQIIREIQSQIQLAIDSMEKSAGEVTTGQEVVLAAGQSFAAIQQQMDNVHQAVLGITANVQVLSASSGKVIAEVEKIRDISQETAASSQTISAATEEQSAGMQEIASAAESLAQLSGQLEGTLQQYKF